MKRNFSDYVVALSVIICSAILLGALTIALTGFRFQKPSRTLQIDFEDVTGVKMHSEVRYAGAPAGRDVSTPSTTPVGRVCSARLPCESRA